jgi:hypothetical protein
MPPHKHWKIACHGFSSVLPPSILRWTSRACAVLGHSAAACDGRPDCVLSQPPFCTVPCLCTDVLSPRFLQVPAELPSCPLTTPLLFARFLFLCRLHNGQTYQEGRCDRKVRHPLRCRAPEAREEDGNLPALAIQLRVLR